MSDALPEFEGSDIAGTTDQFSGNVGTTSIKVPTVAGFAIAGVFVENMSTGDDNLLVSFDGGVEWKTVQPECWFSGELRGGITQIDIKSSANTVDYEIVLNRQDC